VRESIRICSKRIFPSYRALSKRAFRGEWLRALHKPPRADDGTARIFQVLNPLKDLPKERQPRERSSGALTAKGSFPAFRKIGPRSGWAAFTRRPRISCARPCARRRYELHRGGLGGSGLGLWRPELGKIITKSQADGRFRGFPSPVPTTYR
jgi:hypothetical protein